MRLINNSSFTDNRQFQRFCEFLDIQCEPVNNHPLFNYDRLEAVYKTIEHTFDPFLIKNSYKKKLEEENKITLKLSTEITRVERGASENWILNVSQGDKSSKINCSAAINATYAGTNSILDLFGFEEWNLQHEISEIGLIEAPEIAHLGLTVMDGPFGSIMPYGKSGLLSISSVAYTHHKISYANKPEFDCMQKTIGCAPSQLADCNSCPAQPASNIKKMTAQMSQYFSKPIDWKHFKSLFTIKSKLKSSHIDDGRPTEIRQFSEKPYFYGIFAGKINSIYEIEKVVKI